MYVIALGPTLALAETRIIIDIHPNYLQLPSLGSEICYFQHHPDFGYFSEREVECEPQTALAGFRIVPISQTPSVIHA